MNAWPILERGVSKAVAINDIDVEKALFELAKYDIKAGPCGSATLAGLRTLGDLPKDSVVLLLCEYIFQCPGKLCVLITFLHRY